MLLKLKCIAETFSKDLLEYSLTPGSLTQCDTLDFSPNKFLIEEIRNKAK